MNWSLNLSFWQENTDRLKDRWLLLKFSNKFVVIVVVLFWVDKLFKMFGIPKLSFLVENKDYYNKAFFYLNLGQWS